jgi:serpin B
MGIPYPLQLSLIPCVQAYMKRIIAASLAGLVLMTQLVHAANEPSTKPIVATGNAFAIDLYAKLHTQKGNLCVSPYSISSALDMTSAGARGQTAAQMLAMLHWSDQPGALHDAVADLNLRSERDRFGTELNVANSLFGQSGLNYHPDFLKLLTEKYHAQLQQVDFHQRVRAADQINHWAAAQTHDRITEALPASAIDASTRLVLINAIYFKANWVEPFEKSATKERPFFVDGDQSVNVPLMWQQHAFSYFESDQLQVVALPYQGHYEMDILLPRTRNGLAELEKALTIDSLNTWLTAMQRRLVAISIPRFENSGGFSLKDPLKALGMTDAFDINKANFTGMASDPLYVGDVIHKTFISVNETGTEAAGTTSVVMRLGAVMIRKPEVPVIFCADHPFLYLIRDQSSGAILFMGRVSTPKTE